MNNPIRFIDPDGRSSQTFEGQDAQNAFWHFYFGGSVSNFNGSQSFSSSNGNQFSYNYIDAGGSTGGGGGSIMSSALGNNGQGGGSSLSGWMQSNMGINPAIAGIYAHTAMANFFKNDGSLRLNWFPEQKQSIWKWDLQLRPDLHYMNNGVNAVWELKPVSNFMQSSLSLKGQYQAQGYADVLTTLKNEKFFVGSSQGAPIPPINGRTLSYSGYQFTYNVPIGTDGMIYYNCLNCESPEKQRQPVVDLKTVENTAASIGAAYLIYKIAVGIATWECGGCGVLVTP